MNTNVGDMPIEIFGDYTSDSLDIEFPWEYIVPTINGNAYGNGRGRGNAYVFGNGTGFGYGRLFSYEMDLGFGNGLEEHLYHQREKIFLDGDGNGHEGHG